jgi:RNA polymerase sigma-70 factor (ECF subfamily)
MTPEARFEAMYRQCADEVHAYAMRRAAPAAADDVVNETFLVAWRRLDEVPEQPLPWLLGVARRVLANRRRTDSRIGALRQRLAVEEPAHAGAHDVDDDVNRRVRLALAGLGERDRELLMLIAWEGLRVHEAAEALGVRSGTLAVRLHRARKRLGEALAAENIELELEVGR